MNNYAGAPAAHYTGASPIGATEGRENEPASSFRWRTGLSPLNAFRITQVPLRRSNLEKFPRDKLLHTVLGVTEILRQYEALPLWAPGDHSSTKVAGDSRRDEQTQPRSSVSLNLENPNVKQAIELALNRRSVLLALLLSHLSFTQRKISV